MGDGSSFCMDDEYQNLRTLNSFLLFFSSSMTMFPTHYIPYHSTFKPSGIPDGQGKSPMPETTA